VKIVQRTYAEADHRALVEAGVHPLLARIYAARRIRSNAELRYEASALLPPTLLKGIEEAARLLADAIQSGKRLLIVADYDADGATACAVGLRALRAFGAQAEYLVPDRFKLGYGLSPELVELAAQRRPDLLITVDNGIASVEGVARARHPFDARDAVVDGDEEIRPALRGELHQLGREPIAKLEAVGNEILRLRAERAQRAEADRACGGAVGVVVGDDQQALARLDGVGEQARRLLDAFQKSRGKQGGGFVPELGVRADAAGRVYARKQRMHARLDERAVVGLGVGALDDLHTYFSRARGRRQKRRKSPRMVSNEASRLSGTCTVSMPTRPARRAERSGRNQRFSSASMHSAYSALWPSASGERNMSRRTR